MSCCSLALTRFLTSARDISLLNLGSVVVGRSASGDRDLVKVQGVTSPLNWSRRSRVCSLTRMSMYRSISEAVMMPAVIRAAESTMDRLVFIGLGEV